MRSQTTCSVSSVYILTARLSSAELSEVDCIYMYPNQLKFFLVKSFAENRVKSDLYMNNEKCLAKVYSLHSTLLYNIYACTRIYMYVHVLDIDAHHWLLGTII